MNFSKFSFPYLFAATIFCSALLFVNFPHAWPILQTKWPEFILFTVLLSIASGLEVQLPRTRGDVAVYYPFLILGILVLKEAIIFPCFLAWFWYGLKVYPQQKDIPFRYVVLIFSSIRLVPAILVSIWLYQKTGGSEFAAISQVPWMSFAVMVLSLAFFDILIGNIYIAFREGLPPWKICVPLVTYADVPLSPLAVPIFLLYRNVGFWSLLLFLFPALWIIWFVRQFLLEASKRQEAIEHLNVANELIRSTLHLKEMVENIAQKVEEILKPDSTEIFLRHQNAFALETFRGENLWKGVSPPLEFLQELESVFQKEPLVFLNLAEERHFLSYSKSGISSVLIIPLFAGEEILGCVVCASRIPHYFSADHLNFAKAILGQASQALFGAKLHEQLATTLKELQETQAQLVQSEKMAGLGKLVAGVAHELNNPLNFLSMQLPLLEEKVTSLVELQEIYDSMESIFPPEGREVLAEIKQAKESMHLADFPATSKKFFQACREGTERSKKIVENLRVFARTETVGETWDYVNLHDAIDSTLMILNSLHEGRITIQKNYGEIPKVWCNAPQMNQVFMNVFANAFDAIEGPGTVSISTKTLGDKVEIAIQDSGKGIPQEIQARIFEPFFTTKEVGKGTGLGLSIVYGILKQHKGEITVESNEEKGATFRIVLPVGPEEKKSST